MGGIHALVLLFLMQTGCSPRLDLDQRQLRGLCEAGVVCIVTDARLPKESSEPEPLKPGAPAPLNLAYKVTVLDAEGRIVPNSEVAFNGRRALFDPTTGVHKGKSQTSGTVTIDYLLPIRCGLARCW